MTESISSTRDPTDPENQIHKPDYSSDNYGNYTLQSIQTVANYPADSQPTAFNSRKGSDTLNGLSGTAESNIRRRLHNTDYHTINSPPNPQHVQFIESELANGEIAPERIQSFQRHLREFYNAQNETIESYKQMRKLRSQTVDENTALLHETRKLRDTNGKLIDFAVKLSFYMTFVILAMKIYTSVRSRSIAVLSICVDSGLDLLSQGILLISTRFISRSDPYCYPAGKSRYEPVGIIVFSCIMGMTAVFLLTESIQHLIDDIQNSSTNQTTVHADFIVILLIGIVVFIQFCEFLYCKSVARFTGSGTVSSIADDHVNDVIINIVGGIPAILSGYLPKLFWFDPVGGILLSIYIGCRWSKNCYEQIPHLTGKSADPSIINQLTYLACIADPRILLVDTVLAYYIAPNRLQVEVHIVLPADMPLKEAHDIGESLEITIERIPQVEMAFVHLDYESEHAPEHHNVRGRRKSQVEETE